MPFVVPPRSHSVSSSSFPSSNAPQNAQSPHSKLLFTPFPPGRFSGTLSALLGYPILAVSGLLSLIFLIGSISYSSLLFVPVVFLLPLAFGGLWLARYGSRQMGRIRRFQLYTGHLQGRLFCSLKELASLVGKPEAFVRADVKNMIGMRMFLEGRLSSDESTLLLSNEAYETYRKHSEEEAASAAKREAEQGIPEEVRKVIEEGNDYVRRIREANDAIPNEDITEKLSRLELIVSKIFKQVKKDPKLVPELRKFMSYYLPMTGKLVEAYRDLIQAPIQGTNTVTACKEIEETLDTINLAFENLLDSFFQSTAWDISTDISVLQSMLQQEGLTGKDFTGKDIKHTVEQEVTGGEKEKS